MAAALFLAEIGSLAVAEVVAAFPSLAVAPAGSVGVILPRDGGVMVPKSGHCLPSVGTARAGAEFPFAARMYPAEVLTAWCPMR